MHCKGTVWTTSQKLFRKARTVLVVVVVAIIAVDNFETIHRLLCRMYVFEFDLVQTTASLMGNMLNDKP
jgi:hypothetical protein